MKRIILAGGSGFLGQLLAKHFIRSEWDVVILTRCPEQSGKLGRQVAWDGASFGEWQRELEGATVVINMAGKSVNCRYNERNRQEILNSRLNPTCILGEAIERCKQPPKVWLNASTATLYKHTFGPAWDEQGVVEATAEAKDAFSIEVERAWENAFWNANTPGTRRVAMRTAMVLGMGENSVFPMLRRLVRLGLGGRMGSGRQFVSWLHESDYCNAVEWLLNHDEIVGTVNLAAPNPIRNAEMMRILRQVCRMPFGLPAAEWMLELGAFFLRTETELIIKSRRVGPGRLVKSGFVFEFPNIREAFEDLNSQTYEPDTELETDSLPYRPTSNLSSQSPRWSRAVLAIAGIYNLAWGTWVVFSPTGFFKWAQLPPPNYPQIWQCVGMVVGVYGIGYLLAARDAFRHWPIVFVGLLGKILGAVGMWWSVSRGEFPMKMGWTCVTNDLVWWLPFALILSAYVRSRCRYRGNYL